MKNDALRQRLEKHFKKRLQSIVLDRDEVTIEVALLDFYALMKSCRDDLAFDQLIDVCGVDYLEYGVAQWATESTTATGYGRAVETQNDADVTWDKPRFAVVYHLLSTANNQRLRVRTFVDETAPIIPSIIKIWPCADWFEREAFDLFGILFEGHPDLRRILTDYGFIGHPFRKDFPLSGEVEMRYDANQQRVIYEPVDIEPRILVPKVIRHDNRYVEPSEEGDRNA